MTKWLPCGLIILCTIAVPCWGEEEPFYNAQPIGFWIKALQSGQSAARANAATVLGQFGPPARASVSALTVALGDRHIDVRLAAIVALGQIGPDAVASAPQLARLLDYASDHFDAELAKQAAGTLAKVQPNGGGPLIAALLNSKTFPATGRTVIDVRRLELLSNSLKDQRSGVKLGSVVKGTGQLFAQAFWDEKVDKLADAIEPELKKIQDDEKNKSFGDATVKTLQDIKDYRDQVRIRLDSLKVLLDADRDQWKRVIKPLAASNEGLKILGTVVADHPESAIADVILKEW